jgi:hypothetical protein
VIWQALGSFLSEAWNTVVIVGNRRQAFYSTRSPHFDLLTNKANVRSTIELAQLLKFPVMIGEKYVLRRFESSQAAQLAVTAISTCFSTGSKAV